MTKPTCKYFMDCRGQISVLLTKYRNIKDSEMIKSLSNDLKNLDKEIEYFYPEKRCKHLTNGKLAF